MKQIGNSQYFVHEGELFRRVTPVTHGKHPSYYLTNKQGIRKWYKAEEFIQKYT